MANEQIKKIVEGLTAATRSSTFKWERTDSPNTFILSRPQGLVEVAKFRTREGFSRLRVTIQNAEGNSAAEWIESEARDPMDDLVRQLFEAAKDSALGVTEVLETWLADIEDNTPEPF